jgi:tetratricopeptide (TPR) repeat protein
MYEEAIAEFRKLLKQNPRAAAALAHLGNTYARAGRVREARECLRQLEQRSDVETVETYGIAIIHAGLGEKDQAFDWLEKAYELRDQLSLKVGPTRSPAGPSLPTSCAE